jgi:hypothetical protein
VDPVVGGAVQRTYPDRVVRAARALEGPHRTECRRHVGVGEEGLDVDEFDENRPPSADSAIARSRTGACRVWPGGSYGTKQGDDPSR